MVRAYHPFLHVAESRRLSAGVWRRALPVVAAELADPCRTLRRAGLRPKGVSGGG
jgi:hypothetical protein